MFCLALDGSASLLPGVFLTVKIIARNKDQSSAIGLGEGKQGPQVPGNNDNTLGCEGAGIIAVHYVCSIYTSSHDPTAADGWVITSCSGEHLSGPAAVYGRNEEHLSVKVTALCVLFNSSFLHSC